MTLVFTKGNNSQVIQYIDTDPSTAGNQNELTYTASNWKQGQSLFVYAAASHWTGSATVNVTVKAGSKASYLTKTATLTVNVAAREARPQAKVRLNHNSSSSTYLVVEIASTKAAGDAGNNWALVPVRAKSGEDLASHGRRQQ